LADADLVELVAKPGRLTVEENGESTFGFGEGVDRRLLRRLAAGDYPIDAELDLHGLRRDDAVAALERAIKHARSAGERCLLVIHGRGLNSGDEGPVLKRTVADALADGALSRLVLAFASAPAAVGGAGATLVLLRKPAR
jgi:DNA-nicking Smr family endonuclease